MKYKPHLKINQNFQALSPNNCAIILIDGDGKSVGPCCYFIKNGVCPSHGQIFEDYNYEPVRKKFFRKIFDFLKNKTFWVGSQNIDVLRL